MNHSPKKLNNQQAFSLVEVTIALGVMAFSLFALVGLVPMGLKSDTVSVRQTRAANFCSDLASDLKSTSTTATESKRFACPLNGTKIIYLKEDGSVGTATNATFRATVNLVMPPSPASVSGTILISWPAQQSDLQKAEGYYESFVAIGR